MTGLIASFVVAAIVAARSGKKGFAFFATFAACFGGGVVGRSPYVLSIVTSPFRTSDRMSRFQHELEATYAANAPSGIWKLLAEYDTAAAEIKGFIARGTRRLTIADQVKRAKLVLALSDVGGEPLCAAFFAGPEAKDLLYETLKKLSDENFAMWADLTKKAIEAEIYQAPFTSVSDDSLAVVVDQLFTATPDGDREFLKTQVAAVGTKPIPPSDACRANKLLHNAVLAIEPADGAKFMRFLAEMSSGERRPTSLSATQAPPPRQKGEPPVGRPITNQDREEMARELSE